MKELERYDKWRELTFLSSGLFVCLFTFFNFELIIFYVFFQFYLY